MKKKVQVTEIYSTLEDFAGYDNNSWMQRISSWFMAITNELKLTTLDFEIIRHITTPSTILALAKESVTMKKLLMEIPGYTTSDVSLIEGQLKHILDPIKMAWMCEAYKLSLEDALEDGLKFFDALGPTTEIPHSER